MKLLAPTSRPKDRNFSSRWETALEDSDRLIVAIAGYTKSGKTTIANLLAMYGGFARLEMSAGIRDHLTRGKPRLTVHDLLSKAEELRTAYGADYFARLLAKIIRSTEQRQIAIAGLRSAADYELLRSEFPNLFLIYVHVTTDLRHQYMQDDPDGVARTYDDCFATDMQASREAIRAVADVADFVLMNEPGYPLTPYEQLRKALVQIAMRFPQMSLAWDGPQLCANSSPTGKSAGFEVVRGATVGQVDLASALSKAHGREGDPMANQSGRPVARWLDVAPERPLGNHFHEQTEERLLVVSGGLTCHLRRATLLEDPAVKVDLLPGDLLIVKPGWSHAYTSQWEQTQVVLLPPRSLAEDTSEALLDRVIF